MRESRVNVMRTLLLSGALAAMLATPSHAQIRSAADQRCPGCDSAAMASADLRLREAEISARTIELARNKILVENLRSRLAAGSPEAPRSEKERAELQSMLAIQRQQMDRLQRELSALCGGVAPARGYFGFDIQVSDSVEEGSGRVTVTGLYPLVTRVEPGSPAARAGIMAYDTIVSINKRDVRGQQAFRAFMREPGEKVTVGLARRDGRQEVVVTVGTRPATFGGSCLQYRDVLFSDPSGQSIVTVRRAGARGSGQTVAGSVRVGPTGGGGSARGAPQPMRVQLSPDSMAQATTFFVIPSGAGATALFMSRGANGAIVAGAEVSLINGGLRTIFAVDHGALVLHVAARSPAEQAGILSGDVIVSAQGEAVTSIAILQRAIHAAGERRSVSLDIIRAKQPKTLTLRW
jgi:membrane-associated protease RseP (regulator of RpoE activity)